MFPRDQAPVQLGGGHVSQDGPSSPDYSLSNHRHRRRSSPLHLYGSDRSVADDPTAPSFEAASERPGELAGASLRYGEPVVLADHRQQPPEGRAPGRLR